MSIATVLLLTLLQAQGAPKVLVVCGEAVGTSYYLEPQITGWQADRIRGGSVSLIVDSAGKPDVISRDAMGHSQFSSETGVVLAPLIAESDGAFIFIVVDHGGKEVVTYNVTTNASGRRTMLWTDIKNRKTQAGITKASAFIADCESVPQ